MDAREPRLLLVDDDASTLRLLSRILSAYADQRLATSGRQALQLARAEPPDMMLVDMQMPDMSGAQLCAQLKSEPALAHIPVLFVTADDSEATRLEALQLGASDFVIKPIQPDQLQARVAAVLRSEARLAHAKQEVAARLPAAEPPLHTGPARLLVVDDDEGAIDMLRHTLRGVGEVRSVANGSKALELAMAWRPDLVLVDARMPGMDGFDLCRELLRIPGLGHMPVVFVTRLAEAQHETRALELGAADFITKPYSPAVLKARVRNLLELKRRTDIELAAVASQGQRLDAERLAAVIECASDAIVTLNAAGHIMLMNAAAGRLFGVDHHAAPGTAAETVIGARLPGLDLSAPGAATRVLLQRPPCAPLPVEVTVSCLGEGSLRLSTLMIRDLGDREKLEAEATARAAAEAANRTKALMMSYVAHEIGNPLNCVLGFTQLLRHDLAKAATLSPTQAYRLTMIETGCMQLSMLTKDLSDLGHFELGRLPVQRQSTDVARVVDEAVRTVSVLAQQVKVDLRQEAESSAGLRAVADGNRLRQCLINLISNAIKYNKPQGLVTVSVQGLSSGVEIAVTDTGLGMSEQQVAQLFEPFNRLGRQTSAVQGTGLGLAVTRLLIEAMGGQLRVSSRPGEGSRFTIQLLPAEAPTSQARTPSTSSQGL